MSLLLWNDMYSVGVQEIDNQHKRLLDIANRLNDAMTERQDREAMALILGDLLAYTESHFAYEERLMAKHRFAKAATHELEHRKLVQIVVDLQARLARGDADLSSDVMALLRDWLSRHMMGSDQVLGKALNVRGVR